MKALFWGEGMGKSNFECALLLVLAVAAYSISCSGNNASVGKGDNGNQPPPPPTTNVVTTYHNDNARTGQNLHETALTPGNVNAASFGLLFVIPVDGKVDAQPLYVTNAGIPGSGRHNLLIVATEHDSLYAVDADTGVAIWQASMLLAGETPS